MELKLRGFSYDNRSEKHVCSWAPRAFHNEEHTFRFQDKCRSAIKANHLFQGKKYMNIK
jgi:hypothetical protein